MTSSTILAPGAVALVTGASSGIGRAVARDLLARGLKVVCAGRHRAVLEEAFAADGDDAFALELDVRDTGRVAERLAALPPEFAAIDILVANAGSDVGGRRRFDEGAMADWAGTIETNVTGLMATCHATIPGMLGRGRGHVVTIGSVSGLSTYAHGAAYAASKYAVRAFTECLRKDYKRDPIRITEILPGLVRTGFAQARNHGDAAKAEAFYDSFPAWLEPEDIAAAVAYALGAPGHVNIAQVVVTPTGDK